MTREELFHHYVADTLDEEGTAELERLLADDPAFAAQFAQDLLDTGQFVQVGDELQRVESAPVEEAEPPVATPPPPPSPPVARPRAGTVPPPSPRPPSAPMPRVSAVPPIFSPSEQPQLQSAQARSPVGWIVVAVVLMLGIGAAIYFGVTQEPPPPPENNVIAKVDAVEGKVTLTRQIGTQNVTAGMDIYEGDVINARDGAARVAFVSEKTYLHLRSGSEIRFEEQDAGKTLRLLLGEVTAEAAPQPIGRPMVIETANARAVLIGTRVTVRAIATETLVEVSEGRVRVERQRDGEETVVGAGSWAMVGEDIPLQAWDFVTAVNLNGPATTIDGHAWEAFQSAQSKGLEVEAIGKTVEMHTSAQQPEGFVPHPELRSVLMTSVAAPASKLSLKWPLPNGSYQIFVWLMEDKGEGARSLRLNAEDKLVGENLGQNMKDGAWKRYGPYPAEVNDGSLDLLMSADGSRPVPDPHLAGFAIYSAGPPLPGTPQPQKSPAQAGEDE